MSRPKPSPPLPWEEPGWFELVESWVASELERLDVDRRGSLELVRARPWAAVARVVTSEGDVWFKEPAPSLAFEAAVSNVVASRCPDFTPQVLTTKPPWLLTRDAGQQLRTVLRGGGPASIWDSLLPRYAELQIDLAAATAELLAAGAPDRRPATVLSAYPELVDRVAALAEVDVARLRTLEPRLESLTQALEGSLPATVIHEEFHETNVFVLDGHARLLDWAEAAVSHPFAGLVNTLRDITYRRRLKPGGREMLRLRSVYLEPWTRFAPQRELEELFDQGYVLGALCRALTWDRVLDGQSAAVRAEYGRNAGVWLDLIFREAITDGVKLGL